MIGIFIGSFNPPTKAHLEIASLLKERYEKIVLVPVNSKEKHNISFKDRVYMLNILKRKFSFLDISTIMENYSYLNYRIIDLLRKEYHDIEIIIGADLLDKLDNFEEYGYLLQNYHFIVITRFSLDVKKIIQKKYYDYQDKFSILEYNNDISSRMVRDYLKMNKNVENILDKDIYLYIKEKGFYF